MKYYLLPVFLLSACAGRHTPATGPGGEERDSADEMVDEMEEGDENLPESAEPEGQTPSAGMPMGHEGMPMGHEGMPMGHEGMPPMAMEACHSAMELRAHVAQIGAEDDPAHSGEVAALRALADTLSSLPNGNTDTENAARQVRDRASLIETSGPTSQQHADWTRQALLTAVTALEPLAAGRPELASQIADARKATESIRPDMKFLDQRETIVKAMGTVAQAVETMAMPEGMMCE